jgi:hypothetical protein
MNKVWTKGYVYIMRWVRTIIGRMYIDQWYWRKGTIVLKKDSDYGESDMQSIVCIWKSIWKEVQWLGGSSNVR